MMFWLVVGIVVVVVLALAWRSDRRRRGQQVNDAAVGKQIRGLRRSIDPTGRSWGRK